MQPDLPAVLLELLHHRAKTSASTTPLDMSRYPPAMGVQADARQQALSEQAALILTLLDSLPYLSLQLVEEWLPLVAEVIYCVPDGQMREICKRRFWEVLISGEMDPERSQVAVAWWGTKGGREAVLFGPQAQDEMRSGSLKREGVESKL